MSTYHASIEPRTIQIESNYIELETKIMFAIVPVKWNYRVGELQKCSYTNELGNFYRDQQQVMNMNMNLSSYNSGKTYPAILVI